MSRTESKHGKKIILFSLSTKYSLGPFGKAIELIEKIIIALKDRPNVFNRIEFLPILTDILFRSEIRREHTLQLIQEVSFGISIKTHQSCLERLIKFCVDILCNETDEVSIMCEHDTNL